MHLVTPEITAFPHHGCWQPPCTVTGSASFSFSSTIHPRASLSAPASAFFLLKWLRLFQQHSITVGSSTSVVVGEWGGRGEVETSGEQHDLRPKRNGKRDTRQPDDRPEATNCIKLNATLHHVVGLASLVRTHAHAHMRTLYKVGCSRFKVEQRLPWRMAGLRWVFFFVIQSRKSYQTISDTLACV